MAETACHIEWAAEDAKELVGEEKDRCSNWRRPTSASYIHNSRNEISLASQVDQDPKVRDKIEDEEEDNDDLVKPSKQLSANDKWPMYKKLVENYLDIKKGMEGALLSYIIRKDDAAITDT
eukprot:4844146-Ditylum_brightwellii.AAC.1